MTNFNELNLDMDKIVANTISHDELMQKHLKDKDYQRVYLETSLEEFAKDGNINAFIRSLQHVVKARGRGAISSLARELNMDRSNLSDILNGKVQPKISTALKLINGLGYKIQLKSA
jgi:DNA-binding phage protein